MVRSDFVHPPLGRPQAQKGVGKWSPEALACTVLMPQPWIFGKLFNILALWINIVGIFWCHPQGRPQAQKGVGKWSPEVLACTVLIPQPWILGKLFNILALWINIIGIFWLGSFRLKKVLENRGLASSVLLPQPWILGKLFNILHLWINVIGIFWYHLQGQLRSPAAKVPKVVETLTWIFGYFGKYNNT